MLFTFFLEKEGTTFIEQVEGVDLESALVYWNETSESKPQFKVDSLIGLNGPTKVSGRKNVWCFSDINDENKFVLVHIIATLAD